jgi:hemerythrin-like domain-containing protein
VNDLDSLRRRFLVGAAAAGLVVASRPSTAKPASPRKREEGDIPPTEDLMREHGVLRRVLLVYDEAVRRLVAEDQAAMTAVGAAANLVHRFVEGYHEKLEEDFVFPTLEKAGTLTELTKVLRVQHAAGRKLTEAIMRTAKTGRGATAAERQALVADLRSFARMYGAHAAWEDTELFPSYRKQFSEAELDKLGDRFEEQEHKLLGSAGFEGALREVGDIERTLGIHDLAKFTPL